jgi:hypothetical protein
MLDFIDAAELYEWRSAADTSARPVFQFQNLPGPPMPSHNEIAEFIWRIADHLRGDYEKNDNEDVILPFTLLRRLDCVLEKTRDKVRETEAQVAGKVTDDVLKKLLVGAAGVPFYNRSKFSFTELLKDPANIKENFGTYLEGFSDNIQEILYNFSGGEEKGLAPIYETLARKNLLYLITKEFASETLDLHPNVVSNHDMGLIYEYLIRKFKEGAAAGEQYTPRDVVQLLVQLVFADVEDTLKKSKGTLVAIYDPAVGTGGMVTVAKEYLTTEWGLDPTNVFIYGQELREKTYAICKADALMKLAQVFDLEDFGYTRVVVERPLRLRFEITDERLAEFQKSSFFTGLVVTKKVGDKAKADIARGEEKQRTIIAALKKAKTLCPCYDDRMFQLFIKDALSFKATGQLVTALRSAFGESDEIAEKVLLKPLESDFERATAEADPGSWYQTDNIKAE